RPANRGLALYRRDLQLRRDLAVWLVVAFGAVSPLAPLSADDTWSLRDTGYFSVDGKPQSACEPEPYLVHGVVQHCARCNHGRPGTRKPGPDWTSCGRCPSTAGYRCCAGVSTPTRRCSDRRCRGQEVNT